MNKRLDVNFNALDAGVEARLRASAYPVVTIGSLSDRLQYGCSKRATVEPVGVPILRMSNLQENGWDLSELKYVELSPQEIEAWRLDHGDILFNRTNSKELVGKCEVFDEPGTWVFASYLMRLAVDGSKVHPRFVSSYLSGPSGRAQIERDSRQIIGMTNINAEEIRTLKIPLPDLSTQAVLLGKLDTARAERDRLRAMADAELAGLDAFILDELGLTLPPRVASDGSFAIRRNDVFKARLDAKYNSPRFARLRDMIEASRCDVMSIAHLCLPLATGFAAGAGDQTFEKNGIPHLRPTNITELGELTLARSKFVPSTAIDQKEFLQQGEILFNNTNSPAWVGKSAVFNISDKPCVCSNHITRLRLSDGRNSSVFYAALLNALRSVGYFAALSTDFNNQSGINSDVLSVLRLPKPRAAEQHVIAAEVDRRRAEARRLRAEARALWGTAKQDFENALLGEAV